MYIQHCSRHISVAGQRRRPGPYWNTMPLICNVTLRIIKHITINENTRPVITSVSFWRSHIPMTLSLPSSPEWMGPQRWVWPPPVCIGLNTHGWRTQTQHPVVYSIWSTIDYLLNIMKDIRCFSNARRSLEQVANLKYDWKEIINNPLHTFPKNISRKQSALSSQNFYVINAENE